MIGSAIIIVCSTNLFSNVDLSNLIIESSSQAVSARRNFFHHLLYRFWRECSPFNLVILHPGTDDSDGGIVLRVSGTCKHIISTEGRNSQFVLLASQKKWGTIIE
jgi:hypothetical protein